jgi:hypothetical protein
LNVITNTSFIKIYFIKQTDHRCKFYLQQIDQEMAANAIIHLDERMNNIEARFRGLSYKNKDIQKIIERTNQVYQTFSEQVPSLETPIKANDSMVKSFETQQELNTENFIKHDQTLISIEQENRQIQESTLNINRQTMKTVVNKHSTSLTKVKTPLNARIDAQYVDHLQGLDRIVGAIEACIEGTSYGLTRQMKELIEKIEMLEPSSVHTLNHEFAQRLEQLQRNIVAIEGRVDVTDLRHLASFTGRLTALEPCLDIIDKCLVKPTTEIVELKQLESARSQVHVTLNSLAEAVQTCLSNVHTTARINELEVRIQYLNNTVKEKDGNTKKVNDSISKLKAKCKKSQCHCQGRGDIFQESAIFSLSKEFDKLTSSMKGQTNLVEDLSNQYKKLEDNCAKHACKCNLCLLGLLQLLRKQYETQLGGIKQGLKKNPDVNKVNKGSIGYDIRGFTTEKGDFISRFNELLMKDMAERLECEDEIEKLQERLLESTSVENAINCACKPNVSSKCEASSEMITLKTELQRLWDGIESLYAVFESLEKECQVVLKNNSESIDYGQIANRLMPHIVRIGIQRKIEINEMISQNAEPFQMIFGEFILDINSIDRHEIKTTVCQDEIDRNNVRINQQGVKSNATTPQDEIIQKETE